MIIDFHTHVFSPRIKAERGPYLKDDPCFASLYSSEKAKIATADDLIESMDRDGIDVSVALNLAWSSPRLCRETNDYLMESAARYPKRLIAFGAIPLDSFDDAISEIERCARGGMRGLGELRPGAAFLSAGGQVAELIDAFKQNRLILLLHSSEPVGHIYPGKGDITPDRLYSFISAFPGLTMVCAHWGGGLPFYELMPEVKQATQTVYFDTAASPFLYRPQIYRAVSQIAGADRVLLGSDFPLMAQKRLVNEVRAADISPSDKELILGRNAQRLLGIAG